MALSPVTHCGRAAGQRHPGSRNHQRRSHAASFADVVGTSGWNTRHLSGRVCAIRANQAQAGEFPYTCTYHSTMKAMLRVK